MNINDTLKTSIEKILGNTINNLNMNEDDLIEILEEVVNEYENLQGRYNDLENQLEENYRPIPVSEQYGISDRDFI